MYKLYIAKEKLIDISAISGGINWGDDIDTLGADLNFNMGQSRDPYLPDINVEAGDKVLLYSDETELFRGIITSVDINNNVASYTAHDFAYYLNKSEVVKQYKKTKATEAIKALCKTMGIGIGGIANMNKRITHIYTTTGAEIIDDIIEQESTESGKKYLKEMRGALLYIIEMPSTPIKAMYKPAYNIEPLNVGKKIGTPTINRSIEDMRNSVLAVVGGNDDKMPAKTSLARDSNNVSKYGLLQQIVTVDKDDSKKITSIAKSKLAELNKVTENISFMLPGNDLVRAGRVLEIEDNYSNINGLYRVVSCRHNINNGIHTMDCEVIAT